MPGRKFNTPAYRYGMNGQEKDDEISNIEGANTSAEYWEYDTRLGRRWNVDPIAYPWQSPYTCFNDNSIYYSDPSGLEGEKKDKKNDKKEKVSGPDDGCQSDCQSDVEYAEWRVENPGESVISKPTPKFYWNWKKDPNFKDVGKWSVTLGTGPLPSKILASSSNKPQSYVSWNDSESRTNPGEWNYDITVAYRFPNSVILEANVSKEKYGDFSSGTKLEALTYENLLIGYHLTPEMLKFSNLGRRATLDLALGIGWRSANIENDNISTPQDGMNWLGFNKQTAAQYTVGWGPTLMVTFDYAATKWVSIYASGKVNGLIGRDIETTNGTEKYNLITTNFTTGVKFKIGKIQ